MEALNMVATDILDYERVLYPRCQDLLKLANLEWVEKDSLLRTAEKRTTELTIKLRELQFACDELIKHVRELAGRNGIDGDLINLAYENIRELKHTKNEWDRVSTELEDVNVQIEAHISNNNQLSSETVNLREENTELYKALSSASLRKYAHASTIETTRKRLREEEERSNTFQHRNTQFRRLEGECEGYDERARVNVRDTPQSLHANCEVLKSLNDDLHLQLLLESQLQHDAATNAMSEQEKQKAIEKDVQLVQVENETLREQISAPDKMLHEANVNNGEDMKQVGELKELWQAIDFMTHQNEYILNDIEQIKQDMVTEVQTGMNDIQDSKLSQLPHPLLSPENTEFALQPTPPSCTVNTAQLKQTPIPEYGLYSIYRNEYLYIYLAALASAIATSWHYQL